jgi:TPR repeat protein
MLARGVWLLALVGAGILSGSLNAQEQPSKKRALLVGVKQYQHAALDALKYTENDAVELAPVLRDAGFQVTLLCDSEGVKDVKRQPTRANIDRELKAVLQGVGRDHVVLVGLAGHGLQPDGAAESYFCPTDANPSIERGDGNALAKARFPDTLVSVRGLLKDLDDSGAGRRFLLVDACRNDPGARGRGVADLLGYSGQTGVLLSCSKGQCSYEPDELRHGLFFHYVIKGLAGEAKDSEGEVTWDDLRKYVKRQVSRNVPKPIREAGGSQTPQEFGSQTGEPFPLVKVGGAPDASVAPRPDGDSAARIKLESAVRADLAKFEKAFGLGKNESAFPEGKDWPARWRAAAQLGIPEGQFLYGVYILRDAAMEDKPDEKLRQAVGWVRKAAEQGLAMAQSSLAGLMSRGTGVDKDEAEGFRWAKKAADQGHPQGEFQLASCYLYGDGVAKDEKQGLALLRKAADRGYAAASLRLGFYILQNDMGKAEADAEAVRWFHKAAQQGHAEAQVQMGYCCENGRGVQKDREKAILWYREAYANGEKRGAEYLRKLGVEP